MKFKKFEELPEPVRFSLKDASQKEKTAILNKINKRLSDGELIMNVCESEIEEYGVKF